MKPANFPRAPLLVLGPLVAIFAAGTSSPALHAQSQDSTSVAEAARKAKEQKKAPRKGNRVITEDTINLPPASADSGVRPPAGTVINTTPVAPEAATPTGSTDAAVSSESSKPAGSSDSTPGRDADAPASTDAQKAEEQAAEIRRAKEMLAQARAELDLLKRQLALQNDSYFSNPDYARDSAGKAKLDDLGRMIDEKRTSVEELKQRLEELIEKAGVSPGTDNAPAAPQN